MEFLTEIYVLLYYEQKILNKIPQQIVKGNFSLTKIISEKYYRNTSLCNNIAFSGKIQILKWLRIPNTKYPYPCSWDEYTCAFAVEGGHLKILKWLRTPNPRYGIPCPWDEWSCKCAAVSGYLKILKWLRTHDEKYGTPCPWDKWTHEYAITEEIEEWLIANNCPRE